MADGGAAVAPARAFQPTKEQVIRIRRILEQRAAEAREDAVEFFNFVARHEKTRARIKCAPHQEVALSFFMHHQRTLFVWPVGTSKTFTLAMIVMWLLGRDPTIRVLIVSATQDQAMKVLRMVRDYIGDGGERAKDEEANPGSAELHLVFPHLRRKRGAKWTDRQITIERPSGIRDPSVRAVGLDSKSIPGSRIDVLIGDDMLSEENTGSAEQREKMEHTFDLVLMSRLEPSPSTKVVVNNTPYDPEDLTQTLEKRGWPVMRMEVEGDIFVQDDAEERADAARKGKRFVPWDHPGVRPRSPDVLDPHVRLVAHDPDPDNQEPLWPERYSRDEIEKLRATTPAHTFSKNYKCLARDEELAMCKRQYIERCLKLARDLKVYGFEPSWVPSVQGLTFTGVDLAFSERKKSDLTVLFTFAIRSDGYRQIIDIESGRWPIEKIPERVISKHDAFGSTIVVEDVGAQKTMVGWCHEKRPMMPIQGYTTTGKNKANPIFGVPTIFLELAHGAWLIPNSPQGTQHKEVQALIRGCINYNPKDHTSDHLMAMFFARELARKWGVLAGQDLARALYGGQSIASTIGMR